MIYGDLFNKLFDAVERIEKYIGLRYYTDDVTISGRLNNLEIMPTRSPEPICEKDIIINNNNFTVEYEPELIGDAWVVNNSVIITTIDNENEGKVVHEWGDVEFNGLTGTLMGANGFYDGKLLTVTYYTKQNMLYYDIVFDGGYPETRKIGDNFFTLVIEDSALSDNQKIFIDSKGRVSSYSVTEQVSGVNIFNDLTNGMSYELYSENGNINWRTV